MNKLRSVTLMMVLTMILAIGFQATAQDDVTLRILIHQNPPMVEFMEEFNEAFEEANPNISIDMAVVNANDLGTVTQTRLAAGDVDIVSTTAGFSNSVQDYMAGANPPGWQVLIENGLLYDMSDEPFLENYDPVSYQDAGSFDDGVYSISLGRTVYSGIFYNMDLFDEFDLEVPTVWEDLVAVCETFNEEGIGCMTAGGADGWPIFVGAYGLIGSLFPDQEGYVEGLWTGDTRYDDEENLVMWERMQVYARDMMERGASGIPGDAAPGRFASGAVAMFPGGSWYAPAIEEADPDFDWGYIPFPGSDVEEDNLGWFGKYDQGWMVAADSPNIEAAMTYLAAFSETETYQDFVNAVGFIPTQPDVTLDTQLGEELTPYLDNFTVGFEQYWVAPTGAGQWALPHASFFAPFNEWDDPAAIAERAQADLQAGLDEVFGTE